MHRRHGHGIGHTSLEFNAVEMRFLRGACGLAKWSGDSNAYVCERCGTGEKAIGVTVTEHSLCRYGAGNPQRNLISNHNYFINSGA